MSDETGEVRIFDEDPERVVSVTVGDLETLLDDGMDVEAGFIGIGTVAIHERTCHIQKIDWMDKIGNKPFPRHKVVCSACGLELESDMSRGLPSFYHFCPQCGARVVGK